MQNVGELAALKSQGIKSLDAIFYAFKLVVEQSEHQQSTQKLIYFLFVALREITSDIQTTLNISNLQSEQTVSGHATTLFQDIRQSDEIKDSFQPKYFKMTMGNIRGKKILLITSECNYFPYPVYVFLPYLCMNSFLPHTFLCHLYPKSHEPPADLTQQCPI